MSTVLMQKVSLKMTIIIYIFWASAIPAESLAGDGSPLFYTQKTMFMYCVTRANIATRGGFYISNNTNHAFSAIFSKVFVSIQLVHFTFRDFSFSEHNGRRRLSIRTPRFTFLSLL